MGVRAFWAVVVGGGTLEKAIGDRAWALGWPLLQSYGLSEGSSQVATAALSSLKGDEYRNTEIPVLDHWEVRLSAEGLLEIKGEALFSGYLREEGEDLVFEDPKEEGWFRTSDRMRLEERRLTRVGPELREPRVPVDDVVLRGSTFCPILLVSLSISTSVVGV